jgi:hypothetical protein
MRIVQDSKTGQVGIELGKDEEYDIEEHLHALTEFLSKQAVKFHELSSSYHELVKRLTALEIVLDKVSK